MHLPAKRRTEFDHARIYAFPAHLRESLGLEKLACGNACARARAALRQCSGVCRGDESHDRHMQRLHHVFDDLRLTRGPYPGAVALIERGAGRVRDHLVQRGVGFAGRAHAVAAVHWLARQPMAFDPDADEIAHKAVQGDQAEMLFLAGSDL